MATAPRNLRTIRNNARHIETVTCEREPDFLSAIAHADDLVRAALDLRDQMARSAIADGATYGDVANVLGITRQAAHHRYGRG
jgi:hypothetical protein